MISVKYLQKVSSNNITLTQFQIIVKFFTGFYEDGSIYCDEWGTVG